MAIDPSMWLVALSLMSSNISSPEISSIGASIFFAAGLRTMASFSTEAALLLPLPGALLCSDELLERTSASEPSEFWKPDSG